MARVLIHRCTGCGEYTLKDACPACGGQATPNRPAKFSPEDHYGEYRRKLKQMERGKTPGTEPRGD